MFLQRTITLYMEDCRSRQLRPKTMISYEQTLKLFSLWIEEQKGIFKVEDIKEKHIHEYIDNDVVLAVYCAVLAVMKAVWFSFFVKLTAFRIAPALLNLRSWRIIVIFLVKGLFTQSVSVCCNGCIQLFHIRLWRLFYGDGCFLVFVRFCFYVGGIRVENFSSHQLFLDCLPQNFLKDLFCYVVITETRVRFTLMVVASGAFSVSPKPQNHL